MREFCLSVWGVFANRRGTGLVIEDAPAGVVSGRTAGCKTMAVITTHSEEAMKACNPDFVVENLSKSVKSN